MISGDSNARSGSSVIQHLCDARVADASGDGPLSRAALDGAYEPCGYVAHAFGCANGWRYTNSLEAFRRSYRRGFRLFEVDIVLLGDGTIVAAHNRFEACYGLKKPFRRARADEIAPRFRGVLTTLFERDLIRLVAEHHDIRLILDFKGSMRQRLAMAKRLVTVAREEWGATGGGDADRDLLGRLVPHFARRRELDTLRREYPFKDHVLALYRARRLRSDVRALEFVTNNDVRAVMMRWRERYTPRFDRGLRQAGAVTYVHGLAEAPREAMLDFRRKGVGVYTHGEMLGDLAANAHRHTR